MATRSASRPATTPSPRSRAASGGAPGPAGAGGLVDLNRATELGARRSAGDRAGHGRQDHRGPRGGAVRDGRRPADPQARRREDVRAAQAPGDGPLTCLAAAGSRSGRSPPRGRSRSSAGRWASPVWRSRGAGLLVAWWWSARIATRAGVVVLVGSALLLARLALGPPAPAVGDVPDGRGPWTFDGGGGRGGASRPADRDPAIAWRRADALPGRRHAARLSRGHPGRPPHDRGADPAATRLARTATTSNGSGRSAR